MRIQSLINESVTFSLDEHDPNDEFTDVLSMCFFASRKFFEYAKNKKPFFYKSLTDYSENGKRVQFEPDGDDYDSPTGTMNVYTNGTLNNHTKDDFKETLQHTINELKKYVKIGKLRVEGTKEAYNKPRLQISNKNDVSEIEVIRVPIEQNEAKPANNPELNISNANAERVLKVLGLDYIELAGIISPSEVPKLLMKIRNLSDSKKTDMTRSVESGGRIYDNGADLQRVAGYLDRLTQVLDAAQRKKVGVVYG